MPVFIKLMKNFFLTLILTLVTFFILHSQETTKLDSFVNTWVGVPYKFGGTNKRGIDCSHLTKQIYKDIHGIEIPNTCRVQYKSADVKTSLTSMIPGDLIFFKSSRSPSGWHVGYYIGENKYIHASGRYGVSVDIISSVSKRTIIGIARYLL